MKKLLLFVSAVALAALLAFAFAACGDDDGEGTLTIKNESFTEIIDVSWNGNRYEWSLLPGGNAAMDVPAGSGHVFFKRKENPISARSRDLVRVESGKNREFTFTDNTLIIEAQNSNNTGTLGNLQRTVAWWDDAEGVMQTYHEIRSHVFYYRNNGDIPSGNTGNLHPPKNGERSIAIGGTENARLHLRVNLAKPARLSFWYANRSPFGSSNSAGFSINDTVRQSWSANVNWSFLEFDLSAGNNDLIWEKRDGLHYGARYFLSLDDILIRYTE
jgi:hypothetical protein